MTIIKEIRIFDDSYSFNSDDEKGNVLKNLSKINIFIGENNSGKSRFLRLLVSNELDFKPDNNEIEEINVALSKLRDKKIGEQEQLITGLDPNLHFQNIEFLRTNTYLKIHEAIEELGKTMEIQAKTIEENEKEGNEEYEYFQEIQIHDYAEGMLTDIKELLSDDQIYKPFKKIYIPILRGVRPLNYGNSLKSSDDKSFKEDVYKLRTIEDYFEESDIDISTSFEEPGDVNIFTGLETFDIIFNLLNGKRKQRKIVERLKELMAIFFNVEKVEIISNPKDNGIITVKIGDEIENHIYDLGDGIQSVIIILLSLLLCNDETKENENILVFIEEPEQLLHPGFQRKLIEVLLNCEDFSNFQFFFTSHSNHFLDITLDYDDVSIFTIKKQFDDIKDDDKIPKFLIENLSYGNTNALELLGVRNSSVFLSNSTIWVEGITDRYYIKKYFDIYQNYLKKKAKEHKIPFKQFREDYHYSYVEYAGNNITHWSFLDNENDLDEKEKIYVKRLCGKVFLISDNDNARVIPENYEKDIESNFSEKEIRFKKLKDYLGNRFHLLESKEIENILSKEVLIEVIKDFEKKSGANKKDLSELNKLKKNTKFNESRYSNKNLGEFIDDEILKDNRKRVASYKKGNTISEKQKFCQRAVNHINTYEDLSKEAIILCDEIYQFIAYTNNHKIENYSKICEKTDIPHKPVKFNEIKDL